MKNHRASPRWFLTPACLGLVAMFGARRSAAARLPDRSVILPASDGPSMMKQCSRSTISDAESYWDPTPKEIWSLEGRLTSYLKQPGVRNPRNPLHEFCRQYVGVVVHGRRLIYGNFFHKSQLEHVPWEAVGEKKDFWKERPVIVCDGGDDYFGIVFDVEKQTFDPPQFNGEA